MNQILVGLLSIPAFSEPQDESDFLERLKSVAMEVIPPKTPGRRGASKERVISYYAGRAATALLFREIGIQARVSPAPFYGYLRVTDTANRKMKTLFANISHTHAIAVAALSRFPVGVDVERADRSADKALTRVGLPSEMLWAKRQIPAGGGSVPGGIALWSAKEAFSKAVGLGLKFGLSRFEIRFDGQSPFDAVTRERGPLSLKVPGIALWRHEDFVISVCSEKSELQNLKFFQFRQGDHF
jgi:4'-phosphopantetheinyl transferase EntD